MHIIKRLCFPETMYYNIPVNTSTLSRFETWHKVFSSQLFLLPSPDRRSSSSAARQTYITPHMYLFAAQRETSHSTHTQALVHQLHRAMQTYKSKLSFGYSIRLRCATPCFGLNRSSLSSVKPRKQLEALVGFAATRRFQEPCAHHSALDEVPRDRLHAPAWRS